MQIDRIENPFNFFVSKANEILAKGLNTWFIVHTPISSVLLECIEGEM